MQKFVGLASAIGAVFAMTFIVGCGDTAVPEGAGATGAATAAADGGHVHGDGEGEHSHSHSHGAGPHGGTLADWGGGKYHVEFTVDHEKQEATVYVLGSDEKSPTPIRTDRISLTIGEPEIQTDLLPQPLEGDTDGVSSRFVGKHEMLKTVRDYSGTLTAEIEGTPYTGEFTEQAHEGHDHK